MPNVECGVQNAINTKNKQVREEEHDMGMLMLYMTNLVLDDKESKKMHEKES